MKIIVFWLNSIKICSPGSKYYYSSIGSNNCLGPADKSLSEPVMTKFNDAYIRHTT